MKKIITLLLIFAGYAAHAQDAAAERSEKMSLVKFLVGQWKGSGWMLVEGKKEYFDQTENISAKLDGGVIIVEGMGKVPQTGRIIHNALAILTYDVIKKQYRWTSTTTAGYISDVAPDVSREKFVWTLNNRGGKLRYTITLDKGDWLEIGEQSNDDGKTWTQNFEMRLKKG
nr:hypothetical protein [uncultured Mucilaginibacter sp.]